MIYSIYLCWFSKYGHVYIHRQSRDALALLSVSLCPCGEAGGHIYCTILDSNVIYGSISLQAAFHCSSESNAIFPTFGPIGDFKKNYISE